MIMIFDLDDTLYDESSYVKSSFKAVSFYLSKKFELPMKTIFNDLILVLNDQGRGHIFDKVLKKHKIYRKFEVKKCLSVYRNNVPVIKLFDEAIDILEKLSESTKYLISDGNKFVQSNKVKVLGINKYFKKIYLTHRYGIKNAKPSIYCFNLIKKIEKCNWNQIMYIADDPNKDFINLNPLGVKTVRVHTGRFKNQKAKVGYDALTKINNLSELISTINTI